MRTALLAAVALLLLPVAGSAASHTEFRLRNMTSFVAQIDVEQLTPLNKVLRYVVDPRRTEIRYLVDPMGHFSIHGFGYVGGRREYFKAVGITVRPGNVVTVVLDDVDGFLVLTATSKT